MGDWRRAFSNMRPLLRPDSRIGVVDMQDPRGWAKWLTIFARLACALGGSDIHAAPWRAVEEQCLEIVRASARAGHLQVRAGELHQSSNA